MGRLVQSDYAPNSGLRYLRRCRRLHRWTRTYLLSTPISVCISAFFCVRMRVLRVCIYSIGLDLGMGYQSILILRGLGMVRFFLIIWGVNLFSPCSISIWLNRLGKFYFLTWYLVSLLWFQVVDHGIRGLWDHINVGVLLLFLISFI